jgi:hypothetical protein
MLKYDFSIIIPCRYNLSGLKVTLDSFEIFTKKKDRLEIILVVDSDDEDIPKYQDLLSEYSFTLRLRHVKHSDYFCRDYYNAGALSSEGENVMCFNDDCYMQVYGWDDIIREAIEKNYHFKGIYLIDLFDSTHEDDGCSFPRFPMLSRKVIDLFGFFFYPQVRMWPADKILFSIFSSVGNIIKCHKVKMQHDHVYALDVSKTRMWRIFNEDKANGVFPVDIKHEIKKLKDAILGDT